MTGYHPHAVARRATQARIVVWSVFAVLLLAFFRIQVLSSSRYRVQSEENRLRPIPIAAARGEITDRYGVVLAENVPGYSIALLASSADSLRATLERIAPIASIDSARITSAVARFRRRPTEPVVILRDASFALVSALEERRIALPGLVVQTEPKRRYPFADTAAHLIGYVAEVTEEELRSARFGGVRSGTLVGQDGLERTYDEELRGKDGVRFVEVDALGRTVRDVGVRSSLPPRQGNTIRTSTDIELQRYVAEQFPADKRGAVVVLNPMTGEILAMYSAPSFDPNAFIGGIDEDLWSTLSRSPTHPMINRAVQGLYPPASPWKLAVAVIGLQRGLVDLDARMPIPCRGGLQYFSRFFRCWRVEGHGDVTLAEAIQHSCDVYFYQLGLKIGLRNLLRGAQGLGFREASGLDVPNEATPVFPASTEYYNRRYGPRGWTSAVTLNLAIGQGENAQTPVSMLRFYAMLATRSGVAPTPTLIPGRASSEHRPSLGLSETDRAGLRAALLAVVESGTAAGSRIKDLRIAGKTGTAQNAHGLDHGWFIGFAPADNPQVIAGAVVEFAEHGAGVAPMVTRILARYLLGPDVGDGLPDDYRLVVPEDSAPGPVQILPDTAGLERIAGVDGSGQRRR